MALGTPSFHSVARAVQPAELDAYKAAYFAGVQVALLAGGVVGVVGSIVAWLTLGRRDVLQTVYEHRDERQSAAPPAGSSVTATLPARVRASGSAHQTCQRRRARGRPASTARVLAVDDDPGDGGSSGPPPSRPGQGGDRLLGIARIGRRERCADGRADRAQVPAGRASAEPGASASRRRAQRQPARGGQRRRPLRLAAGSRTCGASRDPRTGRRRRRGRSVRSPRRRASRLRAPSTRRPGRRLCGLPASRSGGRSTQASMHPRTASRVAGGAASRWRSPGSAVDARWRGVAAGRAGTRTRPGRGGAAAPRLDRRSLALAGETSAEVHEALATLDDGERLVVTCRYLLELSEAETAAALGIPAGTVKSRLHRGLRRLRERLEPAMEAAP